MNRLRFYRGNGCWSYIGKQPTWTSQDISIGSGCEYHGTITHEIGHALGFYHTQSRYDRDSWISVDFSNIPADLQYNFEKQTPATETHFGQRYDYGSVMQYGPYAFASDPNKYTIRALYSEYQNSMGQREEPAFSDVRMMNWLYNCSMNCVNSAVPPCRQPGYQDPQSCNKCKCPRMFSGTYCEKLPTGSATNCNGGVVQVNAVACNIYEAMTNT
ncbi:astacin [Oesophagostomum dentatum]|uniref:Metalloendopeptidase n=1 Tax=Oesophagostomum dentatum TaxID=61180 RepID=A0A0B1SX92_OESDE|nr:astacin [Oesophagostomum dentatum]